MRLRANLRERGTVLGTVKTWPGNAGARTAATATASLDAPCARRPAQRAGRDEGTASWHEQRNSLIKADLGAQHGPDHRRGGATSQKPLSQRSQRRVGGGVPR